MEINSRTQLCASAPGKVIILESTLYFIITAVVAAINRRCLKSRIHKDLVGVRIDSNLEIDSNPYTYQHATKSNVQASGESCLSHQYLLPKHSQEVCARSWASNSYQVRINRRRGPW